MQRLLHMTAVLVGATGATVGAAYGMLSQQGRRAHREIMIPDWFPFRADGVYLPDGTGPHPPSAPAGDVLRFAVLGDSLAAGLGVDLPEQLPGVVLARGLAEEADRAVQLDTLALCSCTSRRLGGQVDGALIDPPHAALIMIGANDVTRRIPPWESAKLLGEAVSRLRTAGTTVVVGTCPDLGVVRPIPQPLRAIARTSSLALARLQRDAVRRSGGLPVSLADLLAREFLAQPDVLFSQDHFHPSAAGYAATCSVLLPALCSTFFLAGPDTPEVIVETGAAETVFTLVGRSVKHRARSVVDRARLRAGRVLATRSGSRTAAAGSPGTARPESP